MSTRRKETAKSHSDTVDAARLRPYSKPEILARESIEVMAGVCPGPSGKGAGVCEIPLT